MFESLIYDEEGLLVLNLKQIEADYVSGEYKLNPYGKVYVSCPSGYYPLFAYLSRIAGMKDAKKALKKQDRLPGVPVERGQLARGSGLHALQRALPRGLSPEAPEGPSEGSARPDDAGRRVSGRGAGGGAGHRGPGGHPCGDDPLPGRAGNHRMRIRGRDGHRVRRAAGQQSGQMERGAAEPL